MALTIKWVFIKVSLHFLYYLCNFDDLPLKNILIIVKKLGSQIYWILFLW